MAARLEEGLEMRRRKRFTIRLVALGLAVAAIAATPAQAKLDEGLNGLQPLSMESERLVTADDINRPSPGASSTYVDQQILSADDLSGRVTPAPSRERIVSSEDGYGVWPVAMASIVFLLGTGAVLIAVYQGRNRLAHA